MTKHSIKILPHGRTIKVRSGSNLLAHLIENSILLRSDCGGRGVCGKCRVDVTTSDQLTVTKNACTMEVDQDISIEIPDSSLVSSYIVEKAPAMLPGSFADSSRPQANLKPTYGIAVDLGTTTIALYLCNMTSREVLASLSIKNPQAIYGDDVMSRIGAVTGEAENLHHLQKMIVNSIEWGCDKLADAHSLQLNKLEKMVVVGNPTMIHLFMGVNPQSIGVAPYQPAFFEPRYVDGADIGFTQLRLKVRTLPQLSGFIGGDILAAAIAAEFDKQPVGTLIVDIGTNGELLYKGENRIYATSCATGPAFEGASISCGMQAIPGAIEKVTVADRYSKPQPYVILNSNSSLSQPPSGLCGSGVISVTAELCRTGIIQSHGAFIVDGEIEALTEGTGSSKKYVVSAASDNGKTVEVSISQKDIRSIQLGKAALITGIEFLLKMEKTLHPAKIIVAGAFGSYLEKDDMLVLGMLPRIEHCKITNSGNLAGAGAVMALCDDGYVEQAIDMAASVEVVDLATKVAFQNLFVEKLAFPV